MQGKAGEQSVFVTACKKSLCYNRGPFTPASNFFSDLFHSQREQYQQQPAPSVAGKISQEEQ